MTSINIVLRNEATGELEKLRIGLKRVQADIKKRTPIAKDATKRLENAAYVVGREVGATLNTAGVTAGFVTGGLVAILAKAGNVLGDFAAHAVQQHAMTREVGLTYEQFERLVLAAKARGVSDADARAKVEKLARSVRDLSLGNRSATRDRLEDASRGGTGTRLAKTLQDSLARGGLYETMLEVLQRMSDSAADGSDNGKWAAQVLGETMGVDGPAWHGVQELLEKFRRIVIPSEEASRKYLVQQRKLEIELTKLRNKILAALMPAFTELLRVVGEYFSEENTQKFAKTIRDFAKALLEFDWKKLRDDIDKVLSWVGNEIVLFVSGLADFIETLDRFFQTVNNFRNRSFWKEGQKPVKFQGIGGLGGMSGLEGFGAGGMELPEILVEPEDGAQRFGDLFGAATPQRFSEAIDIELSDKRLIKQTEDMTYEMRRFVDVLRDIRGGAGGGSSEGGVALKARNRPVKTKAGGRGEPRVEKKSDKQPPAEETPLQRTQREDQAAANRRAEVSLGDPPPGIRTAKGSVFGNYTKELGSEYGWNDPDDKFPDGRPKPNYGGYGQNVPGVALPYKGTAGPPGKQEGALVRVWPPGGGPSVLARQIDIGPSQINKRSRDKGIDINAALAESLGYVPEDKRRLGKTTGRPYFPTAAEIKYEVVRPQDLENAQAEMEIERKQVEAASMPIRSRSTMDIEINVTGPRGVTVGASLDQGGDFIPGDEGVRINRRMPAPLTE